MVRSVETAAKLDALCRSWRLSGLIVTGMFQNANHAGSSVSPRYQLTFPNSVSLSSKRPKQDTTAQTESLSFEYSAVRQRWRWKHPLAGPHL